MERDRALKRLDVFVGEWGMEATFPGAPPTGPMGRTVFEWMAGERFLLQRWEVPHPDAPDGIAIIGPSGDGYVQHSFDSRGVARLYEMSLEDGVWKLWRDREDFSPLDFHQRFIGTFEDVGTVIRGRWESSDDGSSWHHDFDLTYRRTT